MGFVKEYGELQNKKSPVTVRETQSIRTMFRRFIVEDELPKEVKIRLRCTTVHKREDDDQVYDYR